MPKEWAEKRDNFTLEHAIAMATKAHEGQVRLSGEPKITHPLAVVAIVRDEMGIKEESMLCAAVLHDCIEDTNLTLEEVLANFGDRVARIVDGVTKIKGKTDHGTTKRVIRLTPEVAIVKLADRLHNMRTLMHMPRNKQIEKAQETLRVYTVLAESLKMWEIKRELEDLCFFYLSQEDYKITEGQLQNDVRTGHEFVNKASAEIAEILTEAGIENTVQARHCGVWEADKKKRKLTQEGLGTMKDLSAVKDVTKFHVVVDEVAMDTVASKLSQDIRARVDPTVTRLIGRNMTDTGYQAIHLLTNYSEGPVEIVILTKEMQESNDWGKVALIRRGETNLGGVPVVRVFDMSGKLRLLPKGATILDMAGEISISVLAKASFALINGRRVTNLSQELGDGDDVVIITDGIKSNLENLAVLPKTRELIRQINNTEERGRLISAGRDMMRRILVPRGLLDIADIGKIDNLLTNFGCANYDDLYTRLGNGSIKIGDVTRRLKSLGLTAKKLNLTTLEFSGIDQVGILWAVVDRINKIGKNINSSVVTTSGDTYYMRLVVQRLSPAEKNQFRKFKDCTVA